MQHNAEGLQQIIMQARVTEALLGNVSTLLTAHSKCSAGQAKLKFAYHQNQGHLC